MNADPRSDPLFRLLADLPSIAPGPAHDRRVLSRCHAAIARQVTVRARAERARTVLAHTLDILFATAVAFYAGVALGEALRLLALRV